MNMIEKNNLKKEIIHKGLPKSTHRAVWKRAQKLLKTMRKPKKSVVIR